MRTILLAAALVGCGSENKVEEQGGDPPTDLTEVPTSPPTGTTPDTSSTESTSPTATSSTSTTSTTATTASPPAPTLPASCPYAADANAVATCAAGGYAALVGPNGHNSIDAAIGAVAADGTVIVCPGIWPGPVVVAAPITLTAADPAPNATVIDGGGVARGLEVTAAATIVGLTIWQGTETSGGGMLAAAPGVTVECGTFLENDAGYSGGAIDADGPLTVRFSTFEGNRAAYEGGGIAMVGDLVIEGSTFVANHADYEGGGLSTGAFSDDTITITDSSFVANTAAYEGGAADIGSWGDDVITVTGCTFEDNASQYGAGALGFGSWGSISGDIAESTFARNSGATAGAIGFDGWLENGSTLTLSASTFEDGVGGGGFLGVDSVAGAISLVGTDLVVLRNSGSGALALAASTLFECTTCDFGAAGSADDNVPVDAIKDGVQTADLPLDFVL